MSFVKNIFKWARKNYTWCTEESNTKMTLGFSLDTMQTRKHWNDIFQTLKEIYCPPGIPSENGQRTQKWKYSSQRQSYPFQNYISWENVLLADLNKKKYKWEFFRKIRCHMETLTYRNERKSARNDEYFSKINYPLFLIFKFLKK